MENKKNIIFLRIFLHCSAWDKSNYIFFKLLCPVRIFAQEYIRDILQRLDNVYTTYVMCTMNMTHIIRLLQNF